MASSGFNVLFLECSEYRVDDLTDEKGLGRANLGASDYRDIFLQKEGRLGGRSSRVAFLKGHHFRAIGRLTGIQLNKNTQ
jgi:hypothetical protein